MLVTNILNKSFQRYNNNDTGKTGTVNKYQLKLRPLKKDTLTISFKGQKITQQNLQQKLRTLENEYFKTDLSDEQLKKQFDLALKISSVLKKANSKGIQLDINSRRYLNKAQKVFQLTADDNEKENLIIATTFLMTEAYEQFGDKAQKSFERIFLPHARTTVTDVSHDEAIDFYRDQDKHQDKDYTKLLQLADKLHSIKDKNSDEYRSTRQQLLQQEFKIYYQEVFETDKYLDRAIKMWAINSLPEDTEKAKIMLQENSIEGLRCVIYTAKDLNTNANTIPYDELAEKVFTLIDSCSNSNDFKNLKNNALKLLKRIYPDLNPQNKAKVIQMAVQRDSVEFIQKHVDKTDPVFSQMRSNYLKKYHSPDSSVKDKRTAFVNLTRLQEPSVRKFIKEIFNDSNADHSLKLAATWAAGCYHSKVNKELLLSIIEPENPVKKGSISEDQLELKEMAMYSLNEYKDKSVDETLKKIAKSASELSELANELISVRQHTLEKVQDYFIKRNSLSRGAQKQYENVRNQFVHDFNSLPEVEKNWIDKALLPFKQYVRELVEMGLKLFVVDDLTTTVGKNHTAQRYGYGFFWDNAPALADEPGIIMVANTFDLPPDKDFVFGHEFGHKLLGYLASHKPAVYKQVKKLYQEAKKNNQFMDYYSAVSIGEYFAQANEAFLSVYKSHSKLIKSNDYESSTSNTKYTLRRKDPELFKILNKMYGKFS